MRDAQLFVIALWVVGLLSGCGGSGEQMRHQLEELEQRNRTGEPMLNDSLAETLADYFDSHGTPNEQMRAKYILGRTYFCLGELPRALETYLEAADCADTTATDCDFSKLSRIHAQIALVFEAQLQPREQLNTLRKAVYYAKKGNDTLISIECYAQEANVYEYLHNDDSIIIVKEHAAAMYRAIGWERHAAQTLGISILPLIRKGESDKARRYLTIYENESGNFDQDGKIEKGREIHYYIKGMYYLSVNKLDSAEFMFRKELRDSRDLNNHIAGCKGLQQVFISRNISDSIAKYATLAYELNDSAYSLSEMQNIQKMQASYNYNHNRLLAEHRKVEVQQARMIMAIVILGVILVLLIFSKQYRRLWRVALDDRLRNAQITCRLREMANANPPLTPDLKDWKELRKFVEHEIPTFPTSLNTDSHPLSDFEYDVCLLIRVHIQPREISKLKNCSPSQITKIRRNLLQRIYGIEGTGDNFDDKIRKIGIKPIRKTTLLKIVKSFSTDIFGIK